MTIKVTALSCVSVGAGSQEVNWWSPDLYGITSCSSLDHHYELYVSKLNILSVTHALQSHPDDVFPKVLLKNFRFVFHSWKGTFFTARVTVWADVSDRGKDSRQCYIHSICLVSQPFRLPNCTKSHIGISCHGYYSLSLIWFDCQGVSWMPKVLVSNHLTLLRWITSHMLCACHGSSTPKIEYVQTISASVFSVF